MLLSFNQLESFKVSSVKTENVLSQTVSRDCKHINDIHDILSCLINRRNTIQYKLYFGTIRAYVPPRGGEACVSYIIPRAMPAENCSWLQIMYESVYSCSGSAQLHQKSHAELKH